MDYTLMDIVELSYYIFGECVSSWNISNKDLAELIVNFKLFSRIKNQAEFYDLEEKKGQHLNYKELYEKMVVL